MATTREIMADLERFVEREVAAVIPTRSFRLLASASAAAGVTPTPHGRTVDFKNTVIIMTSNIGSQHLMEGISAAGDINEAARTAVMQELRQHFRPEFLNRVDDTVLLKIRTLDEIERIVGLLADELRRRAGGRSRWRPQRGHRKPAGH